MKFRFVLAFFIYALPLSGAILSSRFMLNYYSFYHIGVNNAANAGFEVFFILPAMVVGLFFTLYISLFVARRLKLRERGIFLFRFGSIIVVLISSILFRVSNVSNYPTERPQNLTEFLEIDHIIRFDFPKSNPTSY